METISRNLVCTLKEFTSESWKVVRMLVFYWLRASFQREQKGKHVRSGTTGAQLLAAPVRTEKGLWI